MSKYVLALLILFYCQSIFAQNNPPPPPLSSDISQDIGQEEVDTGDTLKNVSWSNWQSLVLLMPGGKTQKWQVTSATKAGLTHTSGNSINLTVSGDEELNLAKYVFTDTFKGGGLYSRSGSPNFPSTTTAQFFFVKNTLRWHFQQRIYALLGLGWERDKAKGLEHDYRGSTGFGFFIVQNPKVNLTAEAGYRINHEDRIQPADDETLHSALATLNLSWQINNHSTLTETLETLQNVRNMDDFRINTDTQLSFQLLKHLYFATYYQIQFDNKPVLGFVKTDMRTTGSIMLYF